MMIPWLPILPAAVWQAAKFLITGRGKLPSGTENRTADHIGSQTARSRLLVFSLAWLLVPLVFFSFSGSKLPGYILPSVPAAILAVSVYIYDRLVKTPGVARLLKAAALTTYVIVVSALLLVVPEFAREESVKALAETANARGYASAPVVSYLTVSHNAEFYMAGRVVRGPFGKQRRFVGPPDLLEYVREHGHGPVIVLVPLEHLRHLTGIPELQAEVLSDNGELAIAVTRLK
jgi:4-amino-4-deoxy-L-arabinose transferase-like glycosyltransferase